jgi:hypothetical protein
MAVHTDGRKIDALSTDFIPVVQAEKTAHGMMSRYAHVQSVTAWKSNGGTAFNLRRTDVGPVLDRWYRDNNETALATGERGYER